MIGRGERRATGAYTKLRLLMWKNFLQQRRHRVQTLVEVLLPVSAMALLLIMRSQIKPTMEGLQTYPAVPAYSLHYSLKVLGGMNISQMGIAYSPESPVLEDILKKATAKLISLNKGDKALKHLILNRFPEIIPPTLDLLGDPDAIEKLIRIRVYAHKNSESLRNIYSSEEVTRRIIAGVEFDDALYGATRLSANLKYSLRFPERPRQYSFYSEGAMSWHTDATFPHFQLTGPRNPLAWDGGDAPGYVIEMFIALQHLISMELILKVTALDLRNFKVDISRYPHPPFIQDFTVESMQFLLPMLILVSFSFIAMNTVRAIVVEKEKQLKETMKIMGLPTWLHWTAWFCKQFIFLLIITVLIVILFKVHWFTTKEGFTNYAVFTNTPWTVLLFFFLLYSTCTIFFCFMLSGFFSKASTAASFSGMIWFLTYLPATMLMMDLKISTAMQVALCLSINSAMAFGFHFMVVEESAQGLQWSQFWEVTDLYSNRFMFGTVTVMLVVDSVLYMLVALYLEQVLPGPHAVPKPWNFIFRKNFWLHRKVMAAGPPFELEDTPDIIMEKVLGEHTIGVKMRNLTKVYGQNLAVDNFCLDMFNDQITVLLGHNGAGKTTTISMLTGNTEITSGSVWLAGYDMSLQKEAARANLGYCPQLNVLFNELTVHEHFEFFGRLRGLTGQELLNDIDTLITKLELNAKRDYASAGLSGGQKRRLSIGIALSGGPRVVLLDEPTAGMDPASRRELWDLLLKEKIGRSIILTTHFMDEADYLGDRVAIMARGRLQCVGSPFFLKHHYAIGYTLVVVKKEGFQHEACTEIIRRYIPETRIKEDRGTEVTYTLPNDQSHLFEAMLNDLEANINSIRYDNYGLTATTLEDVFMSVGSDLSPNFSVPSDEDTYASVSRLSSDETQIVDIDRGKRTLGQDCLWKQHVLAVWLKLWLVWSRSWRLLLMQVLVSLIMINVTLGILHWIMSVKSTHVRRALSLTTGFVETETLLSYNGTSLSSHGAIANNAYKRMFISANIKTMKITVLENGDIKDYYLHRTAQPLKMAFLQKRILIGATFDDNSATAWFSNFGYHDVAISLNAVHQALLKTWLPDATLSVFNYPLSVNYLDRGDMRIYVDHVSMQLSSGLGSSLSIVSSIFVMFYVKERIIRAKLLQNAAGIQPVVMWGSAALFDWAWFLIICMTIIISLKAFKVVGLSTGPEIGRMYLVLMVYGATMLPLNYLMSLVFPGPVMGFVTMFFLNIVFGNMGSQIVQLLLSPKLETESVAEALDYVLQFFPLYDLIRAVVFLNKVGLTEWSCLRKCDYILALQPTQNCSMETMCMNNFTACCVRGNLFFKWEKPGILRYLTCSLIVCVVLWSVLMFIEYDVYQRLFTSTKKLPPLDESSMDDDVVEEIRKVEQITDTDLAQHSLVAKSLSKYYGKHLAVNQVSFALTGAEVFGLLGVNGAGKTTTFKMLMGDEVISSGDAYVSGYSVKTDITTVHKSIGYCPQFDAVFGELTGRETLRLFSMLRGLPTQHASMRADMLADLLGFTRHLDKRVETCSGGTKRKLSAAVALLGSTRLVFVDEPTAGVDAAAKRRVREELLNDYEYPNYNNPIVWWLMCAVGWLVHASSCAALHTSRATARGKNALLCNVPLTPAVRRRDVGGECVSLVQVWRAILDARRAGRGVVLTSHSMMECEALCSRLTIMVNGIFQCLGTPQHLKHKFSQGFTLTIKIKTFEETTNSIEGEHGVAAVKSYVESNFTTPKLIEEHQGLLTYCLPDREVAWSKMFGIMERCRKQHDVEDYTISQTTLEQIFLLLTKYQKERT